MKIMVALKVFFIAFLIVSNVYAKESTVMIISGKVKDSVTGSPIVGVTISADIDVSSVQTDHNGEFKFIVMTSDPVIMRTNKEGYDSFEKILLPQDRIDLKIRLTLRASQARVTMTDFQRNSYISGTVKGLSQKEYKNYKVLVYILTNKWYIHPFAEDKEGRGFASIRKDGTWRINTIWRGYQAYRVGFLLTNKSAYPLPTVEIVSDNPDKDILSKINSVAHLIIEAPSGI